MSRFEALRIFKIIDDEYNSRKCSSYGLRGYFANLAFHWLKNYNKMFQQNIQTKYHIHIKICSTMKSKVKGNERSLTRLQISFDLSTKTFSSFEQHFMYVTCFFYSVNDLMNFKFTGLRILIEILFHAMLSCDTLHLLHFLKRLSYSKINFFYS